MSAPPPLFLTLCWIFAVAGLDQASKFLILARFTLFEQVPVIPGLFNLTLLFNTGAAFGIMAGAPSVWRQAFFVGMAALALGVMFFFYRQFCSQGRIFVHALGLIAGGAVGNLIDRLRFGAVVDFLDFYLGAHHWPSFNVADAAICVGVGLFILGSFLHPPEGEEK